MPATLSQPLERRTLHRYHPGDCEISGRGFHAAALTIEDGPPDTPEGLLEHYADDPRWPAQCACGYEFQPGDGRKVSSAAIEPIRIKAPFRQLGALSLAAPYSITEYPIPGAPIVSNVIVGGDGNEWFTLEGGSPFLGQFNVATRTIVLFPLGTSGDNFGGIWYGPDKNGAVNQAIWVGNATQNTVQIIDFLGNIQATYSGFGAGASNQPGGLCLGVDGKMYCMMGQASQIAVMSFSAGTWTVNRIATPTAAAFPHGGHACTTDGNVWFCEFAAGVSNLAFITPAGAITEFPLPSGTAGQPYWINQGPDGHMWGTEITGNRIFQITVPGHVVTEWTVPTASSQPGGIWPGTDSCMHFTEKAGNKLGRIPISAAASGSSIGPVIAGSGNTPVTPAYGQPPTAGNRLVLSVFGFAQATLPTTPAGWTVAAQIAGTSCSSTVFTKIAAGGDAAPTIAAATGTTYTCQLAEFPVSGVSSVDQVGTAAGTTSPQTATAGGVDNATGELVVYVAGSRYSAAGAKTLTSTLNNGVSAVDTNNNGTSISNHYDFGYGVTTGHGVADSNSFAFTTTNIVGAAVAIASFKLTSAPVSPILEVTIPTAASNPDKIVLSPDGTMTFTEHDTGKIGILTLPPLIVPIAPPVTPAQNLEGVTIWGASPSPHAVPGP